MIKKQKGISEVISEAILFLIIIAIVAIVITILIPVVARMQSEQRFKIAQDNIQKIDSAIMRVLNEPSGSVVEIGLNLDKQMLSVKKNNEDEITILIISQSIRGDYFEDGIIQYIDSTKYNYRDGKILYSVLEYNNIYFLNEIDTENLKQLKVFIKKIDAETVDIYFHQTYDEEY